MLHHHLTQNLEKLTRNLQLLDQQVILSNVAIKLNRINRKRATHLTD